MGGIKVDQKMIENFTIHIKRLYITRFFEIEYEDFFQEGMLALMTAIENYDPYKKNGASFETFAKVVIKNKLNTLQIKLLRKKRCASKISSTIYTCNDDESIYIHLVEIIPDRQYQDPLKSIISTEILNFLQKHLTRLQFMVFIMHISDFTYIEIAIRINKDKKSVENALAKARKKLRKIIPRLNLQAGFYYLLSLKYLTASTTAVTNIPIPIIGSHWANVRGTVPSQPLSVGI